MQKNMHFDKTYYIKNIFIIKMLINLDSLVTVKLNNVIRI